MSVNVSFIVTQLPHFQFKTALETRSQPCCEADEERHFLADSNVEAGGALVEDQEEPVHDVEDYKHPREGFQKELVNPKMRYFS